MAKHKQRKGGGCFPIFTVIVVSAVILYLFGNVIGSSVGWGAYDKYETTACTFDKPPVFVDILLHIFWPNPEDYSRAVATAAAENRAYLWTATNDNGGNLGVDVGILQINKNVHGHRVGGLTFLLYFPPVNLWVARQIWVENGRSFRGPWYGPDNCGMTFP